MRYRFAGLGDDAIPVEGPGVTASDVITRIRLNGGKLTVGQGDYLQIAQNNPALFVLTPAGNDLMTLTERATGAPGGDYSQLLTYAAIGIAGLILLRAIRG